MNQELEKRISAIVARVRKALLDDRYSIFPMVQTEFLNALKWGSRLSAYKEKNIAEIFPEDIKVQSIKYYPVESNFTTKVEEQLFRSLKTYPVMVRTLAEYHVFAKITYRINESNYFNALNAYNPRIYDTIENTIAILKMEQEANPKIRNNAMAAMNELSKDKKNPVRFVLPFMENPNQTFGNSWGIIGYDQDSEKCSSYFVRKINTRRDFFLDKGICLPVHQAKLEVHRPYFNWLKRYDEENPFHVETL